MSHEKPYTRISNEQFKKWHDQNFYSFVRALLPVGKLKNGVHWECLNPVRGDRTPGSFLISVGGKRLGCWKDFASGDGGGDLISLMAYLRGQDYKSKDVRKSIYKEIMENYFN